MRFLCLHGKGTSAKIFASQSASFRKLLDPEQYEFDFIDAPDPSIAAPGIDLFYPPPYYSFYELNYPTPEQRIEAIKESHKWLLEYMEANGPYDGVMNFSQGCSLTSSLLLYHQLAHPTAEPLFKVAIFICGGVPLDVVASLGVDVTPEARDWDETSKVALMAKASSAAILAHGTKRWGVGFDGISADRESNKRIFGIDFAKVPKSMLIGIPTVHVYGARDPRYPASVTLSHFCDERMRRTFDHGGGHDIPRTGDVSHMMKELVEWCGMMVDRW